MGRMGRRPLLTPAGTTSSQRSGSPKSERPEQQRRSGPADDLHQRELDRTNAGVACLASWTAPTPTDDLACRVRPRRGRLSHLDTEGAIDGGLADAERTGDRAHAHPFRAQLAGGELVHALADQPLEQLEREPVGYRSELGGEGGEGSSTVEATAVVSLSA